MNKWQLAVTIAEINDEISTVSKVIPCLLWFCFTFPNHFVYKSEDRILIRLPCCLHLLWLVQTGYLGFGLRHSMQKPLNITTTQATIPRLMWCFTSLWRWRDYNSSGLIKSLMWTCLTLPFFCHQKMSFVWYHVRTSHLKSKYSAILRNTLLDWWVWEWIMFPVGPIIRSVKSPLPFVQVLVVY